MERRRRDGDALTGEQPGAAGSPGRATPAHEAALAVRSGLTLGASLLVTWSVAAIVKLQVPAHLGPERQGQFAFAESFAAVCFALIGLGIDTHLMRTVAVRPAYASEIVGGVLALRALVASAVLAVATGALRLSGQPDEVVLTFAVFGVASLLLAGNATLATVLQASGVAAPVAGANVTGKVAWGAGTALALHAHASLPMLALALPAAELVRAAVLAPVAWRRLGLRMRIDVAAVGGALAASSPFLVNALALGMLMNLGVPILELVRTDPREVGWFSAVQNLAALCSLLIPLIGWVVMPALARAYARSEREGVDVLRVAVRGLVLAVAPVTVLVSAGADVLVRLAFGEAYAPAVPGLAILSLVFVMTYVDTLLATALAVVNRGWSVTLVSLGAVGVNAALMPVSVPIGRALVGAGGECAGAAASIVVTEVLVMIAMVSRFDESPLDGRTVRAIAGCVAIGTAVLLVDRALRPIGPARLVLDGLLYAGLALALRVVRLSELRGAVRLLRRPAG